MADADPEKDIFSQCKVCNAQTNETTILKHMSFKKTLVHNVLKTCKDHNSEQYEIVKDAIAELRKIKMRKFSQVYDEDNKETKRQKQAKRDEANKETKRQKQAKRDATNRQSQDHMEKKRISKRKYDQTHINQNKEYKDKYNQDHREENRKKEEIRRQKKRDETPADLRLKKFKLDIIDGPNFTCQSCDKELFKPQVQFLSQEDLSPKHKLKPSFLKEVGLQGKLKIILCHNCLKLIRNSKIPGTNVSNGLKLEAVPSELKLNDLEQQLIARSLLFIKTLLLPKTRMKASHDDVINVPIECEDISANILKLPRHPNDAKIVPVQLKRKLKYKNTHLVQYIRPNVVLKALKTLKKMGNKFYQDVVIHEEFMEKEIKTLEIKSARDQRLEKRNALKQAKENTFDEKMDVDNEENEGEVDNAEEIASSENEDETDVLKAVKKYQSKQDRNTFLVPKNLDSMVVLNNTAEVMEKQKGEKIFQIAPGEGKIPNPLMREEHFDVRAFPKHHPSGKFGLHHPRKQKLSARKYFEQRLLNADERFSKDPCYVFTAAYFLERQSIENQINISGMFYCCCFHF